MTDGLAPPHPLLSSEAEARAYVEGRCDQASVGRLEHLAELLLSENQRQNLISKSSQEVIWLRHLADSVQLLDYVSRETLDSSNPAPWLDLGTGAGFPGLVIAAVLPDFPIVLVESRARRVEFLEACARALRLSQCKVIGKRLELIEPFEASVISARAFAPLEKLLRLSAPFSTKETRYVLPKGRSAAHELAEQKPPIRKMFHVKPSLTDSEAGIIMSI